MRRSAAGRRTFYLLIAAIISVVALTVASYAWMSISTTPTVTDLALTVISENALQLAHDDGGKPAGDWSTIMDLADPTQELALRPVTYVESEDAFFAPDYGLDGRIDGIKTRLTDVNGALLSEFAAAEDKSGYLYICDFWIRTNASDCTVALTPPIEREDGVLGAGTFMVGEPVWDAGSVSHIDAGNGAQYAMRLALRVDPVDDFGEQNEPAFIIYEPNADGGTGLTETKSAKGNGSLQGEDNLLLQQSVSSWTEADPVLKDTVLYFPGNFLTDDLCLFPLRSGHARHVTLYIWLEGQDADCTASIGGGRLISNIQFTAVTGDDENNLRPD